MTQGTENAIRTAVGKRGSLFVNDTSAYNSTDMYNNSGQVINNWTLVHCITNTQFYILDDNIRSTLSNDLTSTAVTFPTGSIIGGEFTKVQLRSGKAVIYV